MSDLIDFSPPGQVTFSLAGAKARFYDEGTTNLRTVYADRALTVAHPSPLLADSSGRFAQAFVDGDFSVKVVVTRSNDATGYTLDPAPQSEAGPLQDGAYNIYSTRAAFVADLASLASVINGTVVTAAGYEYIRDSTATAIPDMAGWLPVRPATPYHFGATPGTGTDSTTAMNAWLAIAGDLFLPAGNWRVDGTLALVSETTLRGIPGQSFIFQFGAKLIQGPVDLENFVMDGIGFDWRSSGTGLDNAYSVWANLDSHKSCRFTNLYFIRYNELTILERHPTNDATINTIYNTYGPWEIESCAHVAQSIGHEGNYVYRFQGDGTTTLINTAIAWPEMYNSSVVVLKESSNRIFTELTRGTDYTVAYPSGVCQVTMTSAPSTNERIHIWTSVAVSTGAGNRRPISNNAWSVRANYVFRRGFTDVRWVDAEKYSDCRIRLAANSSRIFDHNPYALRSGQAGDFTSYEHCVLTYIADTGFVTDTDTIYAWDFGPGCAGMRALACSMDFIWQGTDGSSRIVTSLDRQVAAITGLTINTTSGSPNITAATGSFTDHFTMLGGAARDRIYINGADYVINSMTAGAMTLATNVTATLAGAAVSRYSPTALVDYNLDLLNTGAGYAPNRGRMGEIKTRSATHTFGTATILNGQSSIVVTHNLYRRPNLWEIQVTAGTNAGKDFWVNTITDDTFTISLASAAGSDCPYGYNVELIRAD